MQVFHEVCDERFDERYTYDQRKIGRLTIVEYRDSVTGEPWRVGFWSKGAPTIPRTGTKREIRDAAIQLQKLPRAGV